MENNSSKLIIHNGLVAGALISSKFLIGAVDVPILSSFTFLISIGIVVYLYMATKNFRDQFFASEFRYGKAFKHVFSVYVFGSFIGSVVIFAYALINPDFLGNTLNQILITYDKLNIKLDEAAYESLNGIFKPLSFKIGRAHV